MTQPERSAVLTRPAIGRVAAALLAGAAGDALGWPLEPTNQRLGSRRSFRFTGRYERWERRFGGRFYPCAESVLPGEYSDDTQLVLATARALTHAGDDWWDTFVGAELPTWTLYERGGGGATKRAAAQWAQGRQPWTAPGGEDGRYFEAGGNGAAMRVLPHAVTASSADSLRQAVFRNAAATHGHARAVVGALVYAAACRVALAGTPPWPLGGLLDGVLDSAALWRPPSSDELAAVLHVSGNRAAVVPAGYERRWRETVAEVDAGLRSSRASLDQGALALDQTLLKELGAFNQEMFGAGTVAALAAVAIATRYAADPATGLRVAASALGADTDTLAGMTGTLLGAMLGDEWLLADWREVQDAALFRAVAADLVGTTGGVRKHAKEKAPLWVTESDLRTWRRCVGEATTGITLGPLGHCEVRPSEPLRPLSRSVRAERWWLRTAGGQTLYVTRLERVKGGQTPPASPETEGGVRTTPSVAGARTSGRALVDLEALAAAAPAELTGQQLLGLVNQLARAMARDCGAAEPHKFARTPTPELIESWFREVRRTTRLPIGTNEFQLLLVRVAWRLVFGTRANGGGGPDETSHS